MKEFSQTGGSRIGEGWLTALNSSAFVRLFATRSHIELSGGGRELWFPKAEILRLSRHDGTTCAELKIDHSIAGIPKRVIFWSPDFEELTTSIQALGYDVFGSTR